VLYAGERKSERQVKEAVDRARAEIEMTKAAEISRLRSENRALEKELERSKTRYANLKSLIEAKAKEAEQIRPPESTNETKERFSRLGYPHIP
jgi:regulator of replication initiation timing